MKVMRLAAAVALVGTIAGMPGPAVAQDVAPDTLLERLLLPNPPSVYLSSLSSRAAPGSSSGSPSAFGPSWGDAFVGGGFQIVRFTDRPDGSITTGFGLGNGRDLVGLEVDITSLSTVRNGFFTRNALGFKLHRVLPGSVGFAVGWENAIVLGGETDGGNSLYGVVTKVMPLGLRGPDDLFNTITLSVGVGNGRFRTISEVRNEKEAVNVFASAGLRVKKWASVIADWPGQDLTLGASFTPFRRIPIVVTPAFADLLGRVNDTPRFVVGAGMGFRFADLTGMFSSNHRSR
jgi:hypothetical protein